MAWVSSKQTPSWSRVWDRLQRSCVVSVSSKADPKGPFRPQVSHHLLAGSSCQPGLAGGVIVLAFTGWSRSDGPGRRAAGGGSRLPAAWPGSACRRASAAVGPVGVSAVASDSSAVGASSAGRGALEWWAGWAAPGAARQWPRAGGAGGRAQQRGAAAAGTRTCARFGSATGRPGSGPGSP
jgi:hypothetical protein